MEKLDPKYIITRDRDKESHYEYDLRGFTLAIMEFFYDSVQGEGVSAGQPASFLRLKGCTLDCIWCDTEWRKGNVYPFDEIFSRMEKVRLIDKFDDGQMLVLTGGSPLHQQDHLLMFLQQFRYRYDFIPRIEIENECTLEPGFQLVELIDQWNNSPKLANSGMKRSVRYKPAIIKYLSGLKNSWFKFVIEAEEDWEEIQIDFVDPGLIRKDQILLMPLAGDLEELQGREGLVRKLATKFKVGYSSREQLVLHVP